MGMGRVVDGSQRGPVKQSKRSESGPGWGRLGGWGRKTMDEVEAWGSTLNSFLSRESKSMRCEWLCHALYLKHSCTSSPRSKLANLRLSLIARLSHVHHDWQDRVSPSLPS
eukprot:scaffold20493_cov125-Isochrysis_galbana.AAC.1